MIYGKRNLAAGTLLPAGGLRQVLAVMRTFPASPVDPWRWNLYPTKRGMEREPIPCFGVRARAAFGAADTLDTVRIAAEAGATFDVWWSDDADDDLSQIAPAPSPIVLARLSAAAGAQIPANVIDCRALASLAAAITNLDSVSRTLNLTPQDETGANLASYAGTAMVQGAGSSGIMYVASGVSAYPVLPPRIAVSVPANAGAGSVSVVVYGVPA